MGGVEGKPLRDFLARSATLPAGDQFAEQSAVPTKKETSVRMSLFCWCARRDLNCRGAVLRRVDRCPEVLEIQGLREIMLLNAAKLYYRILKL